MKHSNFEAHVGGSITRIAYAKINLGLRILNKREDGYHSIETLFQRISLFDEVTVKSDVQIGYTGDVLTSDPSDNLCIRAVKVFNSVFGLSCNVHINLKKNIPVGAGLGGGSSDAAETLRALAIMNNISLNDNRLFDAAVRIGSDVPFFLLDKPAAFGEGRGEVLKQAFGLNTNLWIIIITPNFAISTAKAYRMFDEILTKQRKCINIHFRKFLTHSIELESTYSYNDFESVIFSEYKDLCQARDKLLDSGAGNAGLSGSGSSIFGIYDDEASARAAASQWHSPWQVYVCRPC